VAFLKYLRVLHGSLLLRSISGEGLSINAFIGPNVNRCGMKATKSAELSANPRVGGVQAANAKLNLMHKGKRIFVSAVAFAAVLTSGCQTFNMTPEKFAEQQMGHYDCTAGGKTLEVAGTLLYFLAPASGSRMPDPAPEP